jgi:transposase
MDDPNETLLREPAACCGCGADLAGAPVFDERRQVHDVPPPPKVTECRVVSKTCTACGTTTVGDVPAWTRGRVQYGLRLLARAAWLVCAHHLPVRRAASVLAVLLGTAVSTGWVAAVRAHAARLLEDAFLPRIRELIAAAPVAHADETCARADGALRYLHLACTEYLTRCTSATAPRKRSMRAGSGPRYLARGPGP